MSIPKERARKLRARKARIRLEKHHRHSVPPAIDEADAAYVPPPGSPYILERFSLQLDSAIGDRKFKSVDEANRELGALQRSGALAKPELQALADPKRRAQELAFRAMEADSPEIVLAYAERAIRLDRHCIDAMRTIIENSGAPPQEYLDALAALVVIAEHDAAERYSGDEGRYWGIVPTRPFMRALYDFACVLQLAGIEDESIRRFEQLLALNTNDNQGARYSLLGLYLSDGRPDDARALLERFTEEDFSAVFAWGRVLDRLLAKDMDAAEAALVNARKVNAHAEKYLTGRKRRPRYRPLSYSPGDENEAQCCAAELALAWERNAEATRWLQAQRPV